MAEVYDLIIIGAGPAGITAAIYAARAKLNFLWLEKKFVQGGQVLDTYDVDNYPGLPGISGIELGEKMAEHAKKMGAEVLRETVLLVSLMENGDKLVCTKKNTYQTKAVIFAMGASHRKLMIPGEEELSGMGVSYCATCDGAFYKDMVTVVIGGGNTAVEDALFLSRICKKVYLVHRRKEFRAEKILLEQLKECKNVEFLLEQIPVEILGEDEVCGIRLQNVQTKEEQEIKAEGIFVAVGVVPDTKLCKGLVALSKDGYVIAGEDCATSVPGIFAAGDIRTKSLSQIITAAADGANAVNSVLRE